MPTSPGRDLPARRLRRLATPALLALTILVCARKGAAAEHRLQVGGGTIHVSITAAPPVPEKSLLEWIDTAGRGVTAYLGRYPVPEVRLRVRAGGRGRVHSGATRGGRVPSIRIAIGSATTETDLREDWVLTHEMVHLSFPNTTSDDAWAEEGLATYVEPMARLRVGTISAEKMWGDLMDGLPKGLPRRGDRGLHGTGEWGRTYWGGALFWLLADVTIREQTANRRGLPDALDGIRDAGGDIRANWELRRTLAVADRALGLTVLSDLYRELGTAPGSVDLDDLFRRLGLRREGRRIVYDDSAPLASVRRGIMGPSRP